MLLNDAINGSFEFVGGVLCWLNVWRLIRDKTVKGIYWPVMLLFAAWGFWNLYYYPSLKQMLSFAGSIFFGCG